MYNLIASAVCSVTLLPVRSLFSNRRSPIERWPKADSEMPILAMYASISARSCCVLFIHEA